MARGQQNTLMNLGQLTRAISLRHLSISSLSDGNLGRTSFNHSGGPLALGDLGQTSTRKSPDPFHPLCSFVLQDDMWYC
jgi:hypothetical protein